MINIKNKGESLVEVLVAVGILVVVLITSFVLLNRGIATNVSVKNKIIALNIAREGIEGIRNIRDTNWLRFSGDRRNKWLCIQGVVSQFPAPPGINYCYKNISDGHYKINFDKFFPGFILLEDPSGTNGELNLKDKSKNFSFYSLYKDSSSNRYTHNSTGNFKTIFYRQLILNVEKPPECDSESDAYTCTRDSRLHVVSRVQWREPLIAGDESASSTDLIGTIVMETYLYDYLGRDEY